MANGKYIIVGEQEAPILFPTFMNHNDVAKGFGGKDQVVSAGFFEVGAEKTKKDPDNISVCVYGKSDSLNKGIRSEKDSWLIQRMLRTQHHF